LNKAISVFLAVILGISIMLLPILVSFPTLNGSSGLLSTDLVERFSAAQTLGKSDTGNISFPSSITHAGFIVVVGLIIALSTYFYVKKRTSFPII
jgi:hypothetical protein